MICKHRKRFALHEGDCIAVLKTFPDSTLDSCVTDPPYGLEFMGKEWDSFKTGRSAKYKSGGKLHDPAERRGKGGAGPQYVTRPAKRCAKCAKQKWSGSPCVCAAPEWEMDNSTLHAFQAFNYEWAREVFRVLKPGAHLLAFSGTRTYHRMVCAIEDAGFEIRDQIGWLYGSGFPKSLDVGKAIDKRAGAKRKINGTSRPENRITYQRGMGALRCDLCGNSRNGTSCACELSSPITAAAREWNGWGTALKPAWEPIVVARKPLIGTVAENVQQFRTGAINVDACRVKAAHGDYSSGGENDLTGTGWGHKDRTRTEQHAQGRWPANVIHDGSDEVLAEFAKSGEKSTHGGTTRNRGQAQGMFGVTANSGTTIEASTGTAARFFYCAKASKRDRDEGCEAFAEKIANHTYGKGFDTSTKVRTGEQAVNGVSREPRTNHHPTVKTTALMRYLCKLVTSPGGTVLDPFTGSGSTGKAARAEGFSFVGIEREAEYLAIARARIGHSSSTSSSSSALSPNQKKIKR